MPEAPPEIRAVFPSNEAADMEVLLFLFLVELSFTPEAAALRIATRPFRMSHTADHDTAED
jgi:hypothetical protein